MSRAIGVLAPEHLAIGLVEEAKLVAPLRIYPEPGKGSDDLRGMPAEDIGECIVRQIRALVGSEAIGAVGVGFPGIIRGGVIEESPNLQQVKGLNLQAAISSALREIHIEASVVI